MNSVGRLFHLEISLLSINPGGVPGGGEDQTPGPPRKVEEEEGGGKKSPRRNGPWDLPMEQLPMELGQHASK